MIGEVCRALGVVDLPILSDLVRKTCPVLGDVDRGQPVAIPLMNLLESHREELRSNWPAEAGRWVLGEGFEAEG